MGCSKTSVEMSLKTIGCSALQVGKNLLLETQISPKVLKTLCFSKYRVPGLDHVYKVNVGSESRVPVLKNSP